MPIGTFRLPALELTVDTADGPRSWDGIVYAPLEDADGPASSKVVFVAVGSPGRESVPEWVTEVLRAGTARVKLLAYPRQSWTAIVRLAEGAERDRAWADIKQARHDLSATWDLPEISIVILELQPAR
jgi:hypothetical protein